MISHYVPQKWSLVLHVFSSQEQIPYTVCKLLSILSAIQTPITSVPAKGYQHLLTELLTVSDTTADSGALKDIRVLRFWGVTAVMHKVHSRKPIFCRVTIKYENRKTMTSTMLSFDRNILF